MISPHSLSIVLGQYSLAPFYRAFHESIARMKRECKHNLYFFVSVLQVMKNPTDLHNPLIFLLWNHYIINRVIPYVDSIIWITTLFSRSDRAQMVRPQEVAIGSLTLFHLRDFLLLLHCPRLLKYISRDSQGHYRTTGDTLAYSEFYSFKRLLNEPNTSSCVILSLEAVAYSSASSKAFSTPDVKFE